MAEHLLVKQTPFWAHSIQRESHIRELYRERKRVQETDTQQVPTVVKWTHDYQEKDANKKNNAGQGRRCFYSPLVGNRGSGTVFMARLVCLLSSSLPKLHSQVLSRNKRKE